MTTTTTRNTNEYVTWVEDGYVYVTVKPEVWEAMTKDAWIRAAGFRAGQVLRQSGVQANYRVKVEEVERQRDWATDLPVTITFRTIEAYTDVRAEAA